MLKICEHCKDCFYANVYTYDNETNSCKVKSTGEILGDCDGKESDNFGYNWNEDDDFGLTFITYEYYTRRKPIPAHIVVELDGETVGNLWLKTPKTSESYTTELEYMFQSTLTCRRVHFKVNTVEEAKKLTADWLLKFYRAIFEKLKTEVK